MSEPVVAVCTCCPPAVIEHRCTPSADILQRIYTFSSSMASLLSSREQSSATVQALRALSYVQTLTARVSGGKDMTLARCVMLTLGMCLHVRRHTSDDTGAVMQDALACSFTLTLCSLNFVGALRQHLIKLQEATGTLTHSTRRPDPYATASRAPLAARTASTPVLFPMSPSSESFQTANAAGRQDAVSQSYNAANEPAALRHSSKVRHLILSQVVRSLAVSLVMCTVLATPGRLR